MLHKSAILPGISQFIDEAVLSHYPPNSMKRILAAGAVSLYLKQNENLVDKLLDNPLISALGVSTSEGMIDIDTLRDVLKNEIKKVGFMRISFPIIGDIDFTCEDVDNLYKDLMQSAQPALPNSSLIDSITNGGVY